MTTVGIYIVILGVFGILSNLYYAGKGGVTHGPGILLFSALWAAVNIALILVFGTGSLH